MTEVIAQAPVTEANPTDPSTNTETVDGAGKEDDKYSDRFLKLMNQARAQQKLQSELKAERQKIEEMRKEYDEFTKRKAMVAEDPLEALKLLGTDFDTITQHLLLQGQQPNEIDLLRKDIEEMKAEKKSLLEKQELEKQENLQKQEAELYDTYRSEVANFIENSNYELVKANDGTETVIEYIQQDYLKQLADKVPEPKVLPYEKACEVVEQFLEDNLDKLIALEKVQKKLQQKSNPEQSSNPLQSLFSGTVNKPRESSTTTLTNNMKAASEPVTSSNRRPTEKELFDSAAAQIKFI